MPASCVLAHICGRVQGVGFRYHAQIKARELGVSGWVRNLSDGSVESLICGNALQLQHMQYWFEHGSRYAAVDRVEWVAAEPSLGDALGQRHDRLHNQWQDFRIR